MVRKIQKDEEANCINIMEKSGLGHALNPDTPVNYGQGFESMAGTALTVNNAIGRLTLNGFSEKMLMKKNPKIDDLSAFNIPNYHMIVALTIAERIVPDEEVVASIQSYEVQPLVSAFERKFEKRGLLAAENTHYYNDHTLYCKLLHAVVGAVWKSKDQTEDEMLQNIYEAVAKMRQSEKKVYARIANGLDFDIDENLFPYNDIVDLKEHFEGAVA